MPITCEQVAARLQAEGRSALDDAGLRDHVGECEECADRVIELDEEPAPSPTPTAESAPVAEPPPPTPMAAELSPATALAPPPPGTAPEPTPPTPGSEPAQSAPEPAVVPPLPPDALPPGTEAPPPAAPAAPSEPEAWSGWQPSGLAPGPAGASGRAGPGHISLRPLHLVLGSLGSAIAGGCIVLIVTLLTVGGSPPPEADYDDADLALESLVEPDLEPVFSVAEDEPEEIAREPAGARKGKRKRAARRGKEKTKSRGGTKEEPRAVDAPIPAASGKLAPAQISAGITASISKLGPCLRSASKRNEVDPGRHTLVLDFRILPNGSVRDGRLAGPDYLVGTRLSKCMAKKLKSWRFPKSTNGSPVRNLKLPITVRE